MFMQVQEMEEKLNKLQSGVILVKPEDKKIIEESFSEKVTQWRKRKKMFKELWDNITENSPKDQKEFKVIVPLFLTFSLDFAVCFF
jgi:26S proteasome regulatory subunit (ATPase 3-interacting protein)